MIARFSAAPRFLSRVIVARPSANLRCVCPSLRFLRQPGRPPGGQALSSTNSRSRVLAATSLAIRSQRRRRRHGWLCLWATKSSGSKTSSTASAAAPWIDNRQRVRNPIGGFSRSPDAPDVGSLRTVPAPAASHQPTLGAQRRAAVVMNCQAQAQRGRDDRSRAKRKIDLLRAGYARRPRNECRRLLRHAELCALNRASGRRVGPETRSFDPAAASGAAVGGRLG